MYAEAGGAWHALKWRQGGRLHHVLVWVWKTTELEYFVVGLVERSSFLLQLRTIVLFGANLQHTLRIDRANSLDSVTIPINIEAHVALVMVGGGVSRGRWCVFEGEGGSALCLGSPSPRDSRAVGRPGKH